MSAPVVAGWKLYFAKPPKVWSRRLEVSMDGVTTKVDFSEWRYVLYRRGVDRIDVDMIPPPASQGSDAALRTAAWLGLESEVGELFMIRHIGAVTVSEPAAFSVAESTSFPLLKSHLVTLGLPVDAMTT